MEEASVAPYSAALMHGAIQVTQAYLFCRPVQRQSHATQLSGEHDKAEGVSVNGVSLNQSKTWQRTLFANDFLGVRRFDTLYTPIYLSALADSAAQNTYSARNNMFWTFV